MQSPEKTFDKSMEMFKRLRVKSVEEEYDKTQREPNDAVKFDALHEKLLELLGENRQLLISYVDMLIARYNTDAGFFYDKGFSECQSLFGYFRETLAGNRTIEPHTEKTNADFEDEIGDS